MLFGRLARRLLTLVSRFASDRERSCQSCGALSKSDSLPWEPWLCDWCPRAKNYTYNKDGKVVR